MSDQTRIQTFINEHDTITVNYKDFKFSLDVKQYGAAFLQAIDDVQRPFYEFTDKYESVLAQSVKQLRGIENGLNDIDPNNMKDEERLYVAAAVSTLQDYAWIDHGFHISDAA